MDQDQETMPTRMENIASTASCKIKFRRTVLRESETKNHKDRQGCAYWSRVL
jgi:hypothetical protein